MSFTITCYQPQHREAFARLNLAWIERHFVVEPHDREQLHDPETHVLAGGGQILVAVTPDGSVIGTTALVAVEPGVYELAKMCVTDGYQGQGIGRQLCQAAIEYARQQGATRLWLESSRKLTTALHLYESVGFREVPLVPSPYDRADIRMEMTL